MPERVTRAQAEKAVLDLDALTQRADELFSNIRGDWSDPRRHCRLGFESMAMAAEKIELLRAYLAQRPDEETVRRGHEAASSVFATLEYHAPNEYRSDAWEQDIRAAMYQPEEEAR